MCFHEIWWNSNNPLWPKNTKIWVSNNSGKGLMPAGINPLPQPMLTYHQFFNIFQCDTLKITAIFPKNQWVNHLKNHPWTLSHVQCHQTGGGAKLPQDPHSKEKIHTNSHMLTSTTDPSELRLTPMIQTKFLFTQCRKVDYHLIYHNLIYPGAKCTFNWPTLTFTSYEWQGNHSF